MFSIIFSLNLRGLSDILTKLLPKEPIILEAIFFYCAILGLDKSNLKLKLIFIADKNK